MHWRKPAWGIQRGQPQKWPRKSKVFELCTWWFVRRTSNPPARALG